MEYVQLNIRHTAISALKNTAERQYRLLYGAVLLENFIAANMTEKLWSSTNSMVHYSVH